MACATCDCDRCQAERQLRPTATTHFTCHGRTLVESLIVDLRMMAPNHNAHASMDSFRHGRREAVVILYSSGLVSVAEGWAVKADDFPELLALRAMRD